MADPPPVYLRPAEVAEIFGVSEKTIYRLIHSGRLPGRKIGRSWRVAQAALQRMAADTDQLAVLSQAPGASTSRPDPGASAGLGQDLADIAGALRTAAAGLEAAARRLDSDSGRITP
ncbi:MAG TPA: helix-turn-helix domain-containing protein [Acidimicrobiales bacterium]|nr:helix-turn-helix domain-containing protein [Acidimicrobiales bacterium]